MAQEKRRTRYRSFVTCDSPKGVECGAIRKSKSPNKTPSLEIMKEEKKEMRIREFTRELEKSPSFHLQERAKNLNHVTNSAWPYTNNGDIAKDLLKGVLHLRESLAILTKLQQQSSMRGLMDSTRFGYVERSRLSVDGSSRKSFDEVKSVVRESLLRKNVTNKLDSSNFDSSPRRNKGKASNLIVKLMGLESLPSTPRMHNKGVDKVVNGEVPRPRAIKPMFGTQELGTKQSTFDEILESFNFKGLLRSNSPTFEDFIPIDERPPIVVMRPMRFWGDFDSENDENVMKLSSSRRGIPQETVRNGKASFRGMSARESCELTKKVAYADEKLYIKPQKKKETVRRVSEEEKRETQTRTRIQRDKDGDFSNAMLDYRIVNQKKSRKPVSKVVRKENEACVGEEIDSTRENEFAFPTFDSMLMSKLNIERWNKHSSAMNADYDAENQSSVSDDTRESIEYLNNDPRKSNQIAQIDMHDDNQSLLSEITSTSISENQSSVSVITSVTTNEEVNSDSKNCHTQRAKLKAFFLSSPSFLTRVEELFNLQVNSGLVPQSTVVDVENPRVLLDCASELMDLKRSQLLQVCLKPCVQTMYIQNSPSLSQLLEEVCKGIEDLRCYLNPNPNPKPNQGMVSFSSDQLYDLLDRDLMFKSVTWEIGWKNELFSWDEVEKVVGEVDKFVLANLIEEVLVDFVQ